MQKCGKVVPISIRKATTSVLWEMHWRRRGLSVHHATEHLKIRTRIASLMMTFFSPCFASEQELGHEPKASGVHMPTETIRPRPFRNRFRTVARDAQTLSEMEAGSQWCSRFGIAASESKSGPEDFASYRVEVEEPPDLASSYSNRQPSSRPSFTGSRLISEVSGTHQSTNRALFTCSEWSAANWASTSRQFNRFSGLRR